MIPIEGYQNKMWFNGKALQVPSLHLWRLCVASSCQLRNMVFLRFRLPQDSCAGYSAHTYPEDDPVLTQKYHKIKGDYKGLMVLL